MMGVIAGTMDSTRIGASLIGGFAYSSGQDLNNFVAADGAGVMTVFSYMVIPLVDFNPTTVMVLPTVGITNGSGGVWVRASGGNIPAQILIFGR